MIASDVKFYLSGGTNNSDPKLSLGGAISNTVCGSGTNQLFDIVLPDEVLAGDIEYRCIWVKNTHVSEILYGARIFISEETTSPDTTVLLAYDSAGTQTIANENTPPIGLTFSTPLSYETGIELGDISANIKKMIWLKYIITAGVIKITDEGQLTVMGGVIA